MSLAPVDPGVFSNLFRAGPVGNELGDDAKA